ncbi:hypothetical protein [Kitasatospora purpeofusca]
MSTEHLYALQVGRTRAERGRTRIALVALPYPKRSAPGNLPAP